MNNFEFCCPTKIIFGRNTEGRVGTEAGKFGKKVMLHYGGGSIKKSGLYDRVTASLKEAGLEFVELSGVKPNPGLGLVREGIRFCRESGVDFILAVGGGSVIDSAKAISMGLHYGGDVWDFFSGKAAVKEVTPLGVVLTIPAAGSEASNGTVITNEEGWYKRPYGDQLLRPGFAIMNPELTYTLPAYQTACGAADIMAHVMERYFTNAADVDLTDRLCEAVLKTVIKNTPIALKEPNNYAARAEIMWASTLAHNDLLGTGRKEDWASHNIEHELSGIYDVAHGAGLAVVFPAWMEYVYRHDIERFAQFAVRVWEVDYAFENPEETALEGIKRMKRFFTEIGLPVSLKELSIPGDRLEEMAEKATEAGTLGNFAKLGKADVLSILLLAR